jgi:hypothetical protein
MAESFSDGIRKFQKKLESIMPDEIPFGELFSPDFMSHHTKSPDINAFFTDGGFAVESMEEFEAISVTALDAYVRGHSSFASWGDMKVKAYEEWAQNKMR